MKCKYCIGAGIEYTEGLDNKTNIDTEGISAYIRTETNSNSSEKPTIVFYGGEPLLNQQAIMRIMELTKDIYPNYILYTNGLLLSQIDNAILHNLSRVFVSFDGIREIHDLYRKNNSFDKIQSNVKALRSRFKGTITARVTFTPKSDIYKAVTNCFEYFDAVFWQQVSSQNGVNVELQQKYQAGLDKLITEWFNEIEQHGIVRNIIPFQAILGDYLTGVKNNLLRCGCGSTLRVISANGTIYSCDEMIRVNAGSIGSIYNGTQSITLSTNEIKRCQECNVRYLCGGRCLFSHRFYSDEQNDYYCANTKYLIDKIVEKSSRVVTLIEKGIILLNDINSSHSRGYTEEIP
jgi:putative peptide-modifying radical SAM enzyme